MLKMLVLLFGLLVLAGCGSASDGDDGQAVYIRTPRPTFTVAPLVQQSDPQANPASLVTPETLVASGASEGRGGGILAGNPRVVVNSPLVNVRSGPGVDFEVVAMVERGEEFAVIGRSRDGSWWNICCTEDTSVWIIDELVDADGPVDSAPVTEGQPPISEADFLAAPPPEPVANQPAVAAQPTIAVQPIAQAQPPTPVPTLPPAATATPTPLPVAQVSPSLDLFSLIDQEQFPESSMVRIFLYVYGDNSALPGYSLRVRKDGVDLPVNAASFGGQPAFTWPFADARQRFQNMKVEFVDVNPAGVWEMELVDDDDQTLGPTARFTLAADDPDRELYVRYERK